MKRNKLNILFVCAILSVIATACKKEECHECHYDVNGSEIDLGKKCGSELEMVEKNGVEVDGTIHEVHCHEH